MSDPTAPPQSAADGASRAEAIAEPSAGPPGAGPARAHELADLLDTTTELVCAAGPDGRLTYVNRAWREALGYTAAEAAALRPVDMVAPEHRARYVETARRLVAGETVDAFEAVLLARDGRRLTCRGRAVSVMADTPEGRRCVGTRAFYRDVTPEHTADARRARLVAMLEATADFVGTAAPDGRVEYLNTAGRRLLGLSLDADLETLRAEDYHAPATLARLRAEGLPAATRDGRWVGDGALVGAGGEEIPVSMVVVAHPSLRPGELPYFSAVMRDLRERVAAEAALRASEAQLRQAQKMEAVGQLAGGVAHDFNNLLMVIQGNLDLVREDLSPGHPARGDLDEIGHAAERARVLVRQLLTFSRQQPVQPRRVRLGEAVAGTERLLRRVIGEEIALEVRGADVPAAVLADPGQLDQVLLNLAVNARDAMLTPRHGHPGTGGTLGLEVDEVTLTAAEAGTAAEGWDGIVAGRWARLVVRDTGHGMDAATQARAFEPFFTTKAVGAGTGLGLATVFGIVRQAGGAIRVESAPGRGTAFTVLLPTAEADGGVAARGPVVAPAPGRRATVLLVEDEAPVRTTARRLLERHGHTVVEARHGADALRVWREHGAGRGAAPGAAIDAVVTDLRMPAMGGRELVSRLRAEAPALPVVFVSGYASPQPVPGPHEAFVEKPCTADALLAALDGVLAAATGWSR